MDPSRFLQVLSIPQDTGSLWSLADDKLFSVHFLTTQDPFVPMLILFLLLDKDPKDTCGALTALLDPSGTITVDKDPSMILLDPS